MQTQGPDSMRGEGTVDSPLRTTSNMELLCVALGILDVL